MAPESPPFSAWATSKDSTFSALTASKDFPFQQYTFVCSTFQIWAATKDPTFKIYVSLLFLGSEFPSFVSEGPL